MNRLRKWFGLAGEPDQSREPRERTNPNPDPYVLAKPDVGQTLVDGLIDGDARLAMRADVVVTMGGRGLSILDTDRVL